VDLLAATVLRTVVTGGLMGVLLLATARLADDA
jgi:ABC-2 type transport system permease protein